MKGKDLTHPVIPRRASWKLEEEEENERKWKFLLGDGGEQKTETSPKDPCKEFDQ